MENIKVLFYEVDQDPEERVIENSSDSFDAMVGGRYCIIQLEPDLALIARQSFYATPHPPDNRGFKGPFFVVKNVGDYDEEKYKALTDEEILDFKLHLFGFEMNMMNQIRANGGSLDCLTCAHFNECHGVEFDRA